MINIMLHMMSHNASYDKYNVFHNDYNTYYE